MRNNKQTYKSCDVTYIPRMGYRASWLCPNAYHNLYHGSKTLVLDLIRLIDIAWSEFRLFSLCEYVRRDIGLIATENHCVVSPLIHNLATILVCRLICKDIQDIFDIFCLFVVLVSTIILMFTYSQHVNAINTKT